MIPLDIYLSLTDLWLLLFAGGKVHWFFCGGQEGFGPSVRLVCGKKKRRRFEGGLSFISLIYTCVFVLIGSVWPKSPKERGHCSMVNDSPVMRLHKNWRLNFKYRLKKMNQTNCNHTFLLHFINKFGPCVCERGLFMPQHVLMLMYFCR